MISSLAACAAEHVGVGHARHRHVGVALAAAVAGGLDAHQPRVHRILDVGLEDAVLDEHVALRGVALVVDVERAAPVGDGAVVEHGHALGRDTLADAPGKGARALAVEVAFQPVADGLVQQHAGPARAEHHAHLAGRCGPGLEIGQRGVHGGIDITLQHRVLEVAEAEAPATAAVAHLAPAVLFGDHRHRHAHQRAHVGGARAVGARHQHHVVLGRQPGHHLHHARVLRAGHLLDALQQRHLLRAVERGDRVGGRVQHATARKARLRGHLDALVLARRGDGAHRARRVQQRGFGQLVGVGEGGLLAGHRAHAHALVDAEAAALDDAFLQAPAFVAGALEVQVGIVDAVFADRRQRALQRGLVQPEGFEQQALGDGQAFDRGFAAEHGSVLEG